MLHPPTAESSRISEIFSSLQGEGIHLGERHLFVRFEECHIHCKYCDELEKPGTLMGLTETLHKVLEIDKEEGPHTHVSFTGGEPLLYLPFLKPLAGDLKRIGFSNYLETNGILWRALEETIDLWDCIAMDMKPASVTGEKNFFTEHERFLKIAERTEVFVKIVISRAIDIREFDQLAGIIESVNANIPLVLQPLSAEREGHEDSDLMDLLSCLQKSAARRLKRVSIIPRFHKILKIR